MKDRKENHSTGKAARETARREEGFTLVEIMVVVIILGLLAGLVGPQVIGFLGTGKQSTAKTQISNFGQALDLFKMENGFYPDTVQGLDALVKEPTTGRIPKHGRKGGYLKQKKIPLDPWGGNYVYMKPGPGGEDYYIVSYGSDGV